MNFNSLEFLVFLLIVLPLYWIIPHKFRWILLLVASYYFYMCWNPWLVFLMLGTTLVSYGAALAIEKTEKKTWKKFWLIMALVVCLGILFFFKYFDFLIESVINFFNLFALHLDGFALNLILPIGISFYTFQTLSYVIDVYKGKFAAEKHFGYYALFVCYFPQLVAGPIERPGDLIPQLKSEHKFDKENFAVGFRILLVGFFYKCVVADVVGVYASNVFNNSENANGLAVIIAALLFFVQIYCDFMGYSEIATGAARMMGVKLTRNFNQPYLATSLSDHFRRWHITLTRWFTDYVYIPLGGNQKGKIRKLLNIVIVFLLCGLWHGANWNYVLWGAFVAFILVLENLLGKHLRSFFTRRGVDFEGDTAKGIRRVLMFLIYIPEAILFRSASVGQAGMLFGKLFTSWGFGESFFIATIDTLGLDVLSIFLIVLCVISMVLIFNFGEIGRDKKGPCFETPLREKAFDMQKFNICIYTTLLIAICWLTIIGSQDGSAFLYFQF